MLTEEQAKAASHALLDQPQREQQERAARLTDVREKRRFPPIKWMATGAVTGLIVGGALGYALTDAVSPWSIAGLSIGIAVGVGFDRRLEA